MGEENKWGEQIYIYIYIYSTLPRIRPGTRYAVSTEGWNPKSCPRTVYGRHGINII